MALDHATHATHAALVPPPRPRQMPGVFAVALFVAFFLVLGGIVLKNISKVPFDVTLAGALLLGALAAIDWVRKCYPTRQMAPILLLVVVGVLQIIVRGESGPFSQDQMVKFLGLTVPLILAAGILLSSRASLVILNWAFFAVSVIAAGFSAADGFGRFDELGRATLGGSRDRWCLGVLLSGRFLSLYGTSCRLAFGGLPRQDVLGLDARVTCLWFLDIGIGRPGGSARSRRGRSSHPHLHPRAVPVEVGPVRVCLGSGVAAARSAGVGSD